MGWVVALLAVLLAACGPSMDGLADFDGGIALLPDAQPPADAGAGDDAVPGLEIYTADRTHSPLPPRLVEHLRAIAEGSEKSENVFAKIGASSTKSKAFLHCFAGDNIDLAGRDDLQPTIDFFAAGDADGDTPFDRVSLSATVGWSAGCALDDSCNGPGPGPLDAELAAVSPAFAIVQYGTNDIQLDNLDRYGENMFRIADLLIADGVIPLMGSIMPRGDSAEADLKVPWYNAVARGIAQSREVPFTDFHRELALLPDQGLAADGVHPNVFEGGGCAFTAEGLEHGYNIRNLITLEVLANMRAAVLAYGAPPDDSRLVMEGRGTADEPIVVSTFPFTDVRTTVAAPSDTIASYPGCDATQDESGGEFLYRLTVDETTTIRAIVVSRTGADIDIHLLGGTTGDTCIARDNKVVTATLAPGTYYLSLDTFVTSGTAQTGEFLLAVLRE